MKKIILLLSLLVVGMFLVGCVETAEETVDVVDEQGNLVGEAFRVSKAGKVNTIQVSGTAKDAFTAGQCQKQAEECGLVTDAELENKVKEIIVKNMKDSMIESMSLSSWKQGGLSSEYGSCDKVCESQGKQCVSAFQGDTKPGGSEYNYDQARMFGPMECNREPIRQNGIIWCQCI
jgi:hypothetical protein